MNSGQTIYISHRAHTAVAEYLRSQGFDISFIYDSGKLPPPVASHPDLVICPLKGRVIRGDTSILSPEYPYDARYCAVVLEKLFVHRLDITAPELLSAAKEEGLELLNVRQGYTKCSTVIVNENSIITSDNGIASALYAAGVAVLKITPGHVLLPGHDYGFLGGASGLIGDELLFNGDLSRHPDFEAIKNFVSSRGVKIKYFPGLPLVDIGSVIAL